MAGITALYSRTTREIPLTQRLEHILQSSAMLREMNTFLPSLQNLQVAFGGVYPKHFQRNNYVFSGNEGTVLFYGELYNDLGSISEAELSYRLIAQQGIQSLQNLNGPFALFYWNTKEGTLLAATDRLGRFPLFYSQTDFGICVTTDLHPLFASGKVQPSLHSESIVDLLTIGFPLGDKTMFEGIHRATAGEYLIISPDGIEKKMYWRPVYTNILSTPKPMVETFIACNERAIKKRPGSVVALSGGWDSRATIAVLSHHPEMFSAMTFGEAGSTDVTLASQISAELQLKHTIISSNNIFFDTFGSLANDVITLGSGHTTIDIAFQMFAFKSLAGTTPMLLDSAGCEFRRGIRAKIAAQNAKSSSDITDFLLSMYSTGVWNEEIIGRDFYQAESRSTHKRLTKWLESRSLPSYEEQIDAFSWYELWAHHYAHGYPLQTSVIACHMPYSDNEFYDLFLQADRSIRWSHSFHEAVIHSQQPLLEHIPISYGHVRVPYGEHFFRYAPMAYHKFISSMSKKQGLRWLEQFDNAKPFRPYHKWYVNKLEKYVEEMLFSEAFLSSGFVNKDGVRSLLKKQKLSSHDVSHSISMLLTLAHLVEYVKRMRVKK